MDKTLQNRCECSLEAIYMEIETERERGNYMYIYINIYITIIYTYINIHYTYSYIYIYNTPAQLYIYIYIDRYRYTYEHIYIYMCIFVMSTPDSIQTYCNSLTDTRTNGVGQINEECSKSSHLCMETFHKLKPFKHEVWANPIHFSPPVRHM